MTAPTMHRLGFIDALRAFAILGVFVAHSRVIFLTTPEHALYPLLDHARLGVQLFMLVSGLTLMHAWHARADLGQRDAGWVFVLRRWFRLAPLYYIGLVFYQLLAQVNADVLAAPARLSTIILNALFLHSWWPESQNTGVPGGWSIGVEFSFYLMFAVVVPFIRKPWHALALFIAGALMQGLFKDIYENLLPTVMESMTAAQRDAFLFLWPPRQVPLFMAGMLLYFLIQRPMSPVIGRLLTAMGTLAMLGLMYGKFSMVDETVAYALSLCLIALGVYHAPDRWIVNRLSCFVGRISYSMYIWHFAVLAAGFKLVGPLSDLLGIGGAWTLYIAGSFAASVAVATVSERWIERPGIALGRRILARA